MAVSQSVSAVSPKEARKIVREHKILSQAPHAVLLCQHATTKVRLRLYAKQVLLYMHVGQNSSRGPATNVCVCAWGQEGPGRGAGVRVQTDSIMYYRARRSLNHGRTARQHRLTNSYWQSSKRYNKGIACDATVCGFRTVVWGGVFTRDVPKKKERIRDEVQNKAD